MLSTPSASSIYCRRINYSLSVRGYPIPRNYVYIIIINKDVKNKIDLIEGHRSCTLRDGNCHVSGSVTPLIMGTFIFTWRMYAYT